MVTGAIEVRHDGHAGLFDRLFTGYTEPADSPGADVIRLLGRPTGDGWMLDVCCGGE